MKISVGGRVFITVNTRAASFALAVFALGNAPGKELASVAQLVEAIAAEDGMRTASVGFCAIPLDAEDPLAASAGYRSNVSLVPASTVKAVTTGTALELLGRSFRFQTRLEHTGEIDPEGVLQGDLVIRGGGDPTLGSSPMAPTLERWREALVRAGVTRIEGRVVGDASRFGSQMVPDGWQWNDIGNYYGAGASGLCFHDNLYHCAFRTGSPGTETVFLGTSPRLPGVRFVNEMRAGPSGSGDNGYIYGTPYGVLACLRGTLPPHQARFTIKGSLPDPAFLCARALSKHLVAAGIAIPGEPTTLRRMDLDGETLAAGERGSLHVMQSEPLESLIVLTNHKSVNLRAECIHRMIGLEGGRAGTTVEAARVTKAHWAGKGIDLTGFVMADGCGLSRVNTMTPRQLALILYHLAEGDPETFDAFYASLPVAGRSGTLASIGGGSAAEGRVRAKSGTLDGIRNYAGYLTDRSGRRYAFAILVNHYTGSLSAVKSKIVRIWSAMVD